MVKIKNIIELLDAEPLNVTDTMQIIESTVNSFDELNDENKINVSIKGTSLFAKK